MKETMEVNEVLGLQFVIPVAAVVVCALLVFVFGFKRVPEPKFEYDSSDDRKKKGKTKKKEKTLQSNGHIVNVDPVKVSSKPQQTTEKREVTPKVKPKKLTKDANILPVNHQDKSNEAGNGDDGWTTAVSRKDKKRKKLGLEESAGSGEECAAVEETVQHVSMAEEPPMEQRTKKSKSKTAKAGATETQKVLQPTTTLVPVTEEPKKEEPEPIVQESEQTSPLVTESETVTIDKQPQTPSKKKKNKKKKEPAENQKTETAEMLQAKSGAETGQEMPAHTPAGDNSIEKQLAEAMQEHPVASGDQLKAKISPKRSSKKKSKDASVKASCVSQPDASQSSEAADKPKRSPSPEVQSTSSQSTPAVSSPAETTSTKTGESQPSGSPVSFDEIGEWQEAKPMKKRKKPRRDN